MRLKESTKACMKVSALLWTTNHICCIGSNSSSPHVWNKQVEVEILRSLSLGGPEETFFYQISPCTTGAEASILYTMYDLPPESKKARHFLQTSRKNVIFQLETSD